MHLWVSVWGQEAVGPSLFLKKAAEGVTGGGAPRPEKLQHCRGLVMVPEGPLTVAGFY